MTYVITGLCVGAKRKECVGACPCDSIHEGERQLYINPESCIICGACAQVCPLQAIFPEDEVPSRWKDSIRENAEFFAKPPA